MALRAQDDARGEVRCAAQQGGGSDRKTAKIFVLCSNLPMSCETRVDSMSRMSVAKRAHEVDIGVE